MDFNIEKKINEYLYYGYAITSAETTWLESCLLDYSPEYPYTPTGAGCLLDKIFDDIFFQFSSRGNCVIPISGGWDSRIILGAAMERFENKQIKTFSFGVPGQLDFDIGALISKKLNVEHCQVDLSDITIDWETLFQSIEIIPWTYTPCGFFNYESILRTIGSATDFVLSGFAGESLTGGHSCDAFTDREIIEEFINKQRREKKIWLPNKSYDPKSAIPQKPINSKIAYSELLDFAIRQTNCIVPNVMFQKSWNKWGLYIGKIPHSESDILAPFAHPSWAAYWLKAPKEYKKGQSLYLNMLKEKFPTLASMPSKYTLGTDPGSKVHLMLAKTRRKICYKLNEVFPNAGYSYTGGFNYLDYATVFRKREDYRNILDRAFSYLENNQITPWLDLYKIRNDHMYCKANNVNAILVLIGLALNLEWHYNHKNVR